MADFYVTHHKFPTNPQFFTVNIHKVAGIEPEDNPNFQPSYGRGEEYWKIFIYTTGINSSGDSVGPVIADVVGSYENVNEFVEGYLADLCAQIDWSQQGQFNPEADLNAPIIVEQFPLPSQVNVPITSPVVIRVKDQLPGTGIDPSTVTFIIDGHNVAPNVVGNKYDYTFSFRPKPIIYE